MKRMLLSVLCLGGVGLALLLTDSPNAIGARTFSNKDLKGDYLFILVDIRTEPAFGGATNYCDQAGTISFDGVGPVGTATVSDFTQRCNLATSPGAGTLFYRVSPDGSFLADETPAFLDPTHGQIVDNGNALLLDGTTRTNANILIFHIVAMKR
ncbi:MAG TPA: hypothetical protein VEM38_03630 [Burkholderiales bacterium]|nr:hypothetical protein [Burkholderiales bacterium]